MEFTYQEMELIKEAMTIATISLMNDAYHLNQRIPPRLQDEAEIARLRAKAEQLRKLNANLGSHLR